MAYEKQTWQTGDVITQEKLNHMEDGIEDAYELPAVTETDNGKVLGVENGAWSVVNGGGGGVLVVNATKTSSSGNTYILDKTWQEIHDAFLSVSVIIHQISDDGDGYMAVTAVADGRPEKVVVQAGSVIFLADNATDYPESLK